MVVSPLLELTTGCGTVKGLFSGLSLSAGSGREELPASFLLTSFTLEPGPGQVTIVSCHHADHLLLTSRLLLPEVLGVVVADCVRPGAAPHQAPAQLHLRGGDGGEADGGCEEDLLGDHAESRQPAGGLLWCCCG